jgi:hypothetical protein
MKTKETFGITIRLIAFMAGLMFAIVGAYLLLSGVAILCQQMFLPGALDMLIGFLLVQTGRRMIALRKLGHNV